MIQCLTPEGLAYFIKVTGLEILKDSGDTVVLKGFQVFYWLYNEPMGLFCLIEGITV